MSVSEKTYQQEEVSDLVLYADEIEYFDTHDLSEELANGPEVHSEVSPQARSRFYFEVEPELRTKLKAIATQRGTSAKVLLNEWVREKMAETELVGAAKWNPHMSQGGWNDDCWVSLAGKYRRKASMETQCFHGRG